MGIVRKTLIDFALAALSVARMSGFASSSTMVVQFVNFNNISNNRRLQTTLQSNVLTLAKSRFLSLLSSVHDFEFTREY